MKLESMTDEKLENQKGKEKYFGANKMTIQHC
jgi:hypothetical protein